MDRRLEDLAERLILHRPIGELPDGTLGAKQLHGISNWLQDDLPGTCRFVAAHHRTSAYERPSAYTGASSNPTNRWDPNVALFLSNDDVRDLLPMNECVDVMEDLFNQEARGLVDNRPRQRLRFPDSNWTATLMGGTVLGSDAHGIRHSSVTLLYNTRTGALDAVVEPGMMSWIRTGAASGLAAKHMSRPDASVVGVFGTGRQAVTQLEGLCAVRPVSLVKVYSRSEEHRVAFAEQMRERLGIEVVPVDTPDECVRGSHIVDVITSSREPVFDGSLLEPGTHVIAAGVNSWLKREIDETTIRRADLVVVDNLEDAKLECGELIQAAEQGLFRWSSAVELHRVVSGEVAGCPSAEAITLFESQGIGIEDVAACAYILKKARAQGVGIDLPF